MPAAWARQGSTTSRGRSTPEASAIRSTIPVTGSVGVFTATTDSPAGDVGPTVADGLPSRGPVPPEPDLPPPADGTILAVDIGGIKLVAGIVAPDRRILERIRTATPVAVDPEGA